MAMESKCVPSIRFPTVDVELMDYIASNKPGTVPAHGRVPLQYAHYVSTIIELTNPD